MEFILIAVAQHPPDEDLTGRVGHAIRMAHRRGRHRRRRGRIQGRRGVLDAVLEAENVCNNTAMKYLDDS